MNHDRFHASTGPDLEQFSLRLEKAVAAWKAILPPGNADPSPVESAHVRRPVADVLRELDAEQESLRATTRRLADQISAAAHNRERWEQRAVLAVQEGRDDLAKSALRQQRCDADMVEELQAELRYADSVCHALEEAIGELRSKLASESDAC